MNTRVFFQAYKPVDRRGDLAVGATSSRITIGKAYRTLRLCPADDVYVDFGDSAVQAVVGQGMLLTGGSTEMFTADDVWTNMAFISAAGVPTTMNTTLGEGE